MAPFLTAGGVVVLERRLISRRSIHVAMIDGVSDIAVAVVVAAVLQLTRTPVVVSSLLVILQGL